MHVKHSIKLNSISEWESITQKGNRERGMCHRHLLELQNHLFGELKEYTGVFLRYWAIGQLPQQVRRTSASI